MKKIVIASACRTAIGKFGGTLANVPAAELGSIVIKEVWTAHTSSPSRSTMSTWAALSRLAWARTLHVRLL